MRGVNWGCLLFLAFAAAVDVAAFLAIRALVAGLLAMFAAAA